MSYTKKLLYIAASLEISGLVLLSAVVGSWAMQPSATAYAVPTLVTQAEQQVATSDAPVRISGKPRKVSIPTMEVATIVQDGGYNEKNASWTISEDAAFFAPFTDDVNSVAGNSFIYGHNSQKIFGKLRSSVATGTKAYVETDNGYRFTYTYKESHVVAPNDVSKLSPKSDKPMLILQTCTGLFNQSRKLIYFEFDSYTQL